MPDAGAKSCPNAVKVYLGLHQRIEIDVTNIGQNQREPTFLP